MSAGRNQAKLLLLLLLLSSPTSGCTVVIQTQLVSLWGCWVMVLVCGRGFPAATSDHSLGCGLTAWVLICLQSVWISSCSWVFCSLRVCCSDFISQISDWADWMVLVCWAMTFFRLTMRPAIIWFMILLPSSREGNSIPGT